MLATSPVARLLHARLRVRPQRRGFAWLWPAVLLFVLGACGSPEPVPAPADEDVELEALKALPYLQWDDNADPASRGVTIHDPDRAWPGINLFTDDARRGFAVDMRGRVVHRWQLPDRYRRCEHIELLDDGDAIFVCTGQGMVRLAPDSSVVWQRRLRVHHDVAALPDGGFLVPYSARARRHQGWDVVFDAIGHLSADGELLDSWSSHELLPAIAPHVAPRSVDRQRPEDEAQERAFDYFHLNSIEVLPETELGRRDRRFRAGNLMLCLRNVNLIVILDPTTRELLWHWGPGHLDKPHMPTLLDNGHVLVFDNGASSGRSRVLEVEPVSGEIVWSYPQAPSREAPDSGEPGEVFFSKWRGSNQRLPNGNTLICESERGRALEVTPDGEVVWEFWNPQVRDGKRKRIYRMARVAPSKLVLPPGDP